MRGRFLERAMGTRGAVQAYQRYDSEHLSANLSRYSSAVDHDPIAFSVSNCGSSHIEEVYA
jgi:hypothetical protein